MTKKVETVIILASLTCLAYYVDEKFRLYKQHKQMEDLRNQLKYEKMCNTNLFWWQE